MTSANTAPSPERKKHLRKLMAAGLVGASIEWYDFFIYGTAAALVFGTIFFPDATPLTATLLSFSTFWAGFIARPLGGLVFGHIGDRLGRKPALVTCLILVGGSTVGIGLLPTAAQIGAAAPILLVTLRFLQGIAVGGQWGGVILLLTESAMPGRRGQAGTFGQMGVPFGLILGTVAFLVVGLTVPGEAFIAWGWRIPFLASALLLPIVLFIQTRVEDSPDYRQLKQAADTSREQVVRAPIREAITTQWRRIVLGAGILASSNAVFYIGVAGVLDYGTRDLGMSRDSLLLASLAASAVGVAAIYWAGSASDKLGRKPLMVVGAAAMALWAFPYFWLINTESLFWVFVAVALGGVASSLVYGPYAAYLAELFQPNVRYSAASIAYQLPAIVISGGTPFLMTALLAATGTTLAVSGYMALVALISLSCVLLSPETHKQNGSTQTPPAAAS